LIESKKKEKCNIIIIYQIRVVVEPARGTARGGSHRDRYDDRYGRRGGGRYDR